MRARSLVLWLFALLIAASTSWADEAHDLLDKAIAARGGDQALAKTKAEVSKTKGTISDLNGAGFTGSNSFLGPDRLKQDLTVNIQGTDIRLLVIVNGDKCTLNINEQSQPENPLLTKSLKAATYQRELIRLLPLRDPAYSLQTLPEAQVNGKPAVGLRVSKPGQSDVSLYFDQQTRLLVRMDHRTVDPNSGQEFDEQATIKENMVVDGVTAPRKVVVTRNGNPHVEYEVTELKFVESLPASEFGG